MTNDKFKEEDILKKEMAKVGAMGGLAFGLVGATGGALGAAWVQQYLPTEQFTKTIQVVLSPDAALNAVLAGIRRVGRINNDDSVDEADPVLTAVIKAGFLNMNPAVVFFELSEFGEHASVIRISAFAKEGLIKQHTALKAVGRFLDAATELGKFEELDGSDA